MVLEKEHSFLDHKVQMDVERKAHSIGQCRKSGQVEPLASFQLCRIIITRSSFHSSSNRGDGIEKLHFNAL